MAEKDYTEKTLEAYNDVFVDIVNGLLFEGEEVIHEDELTDETTHSIYKADGKLHKQERDIAKYWKNNRVRIALYGLENQTNPDPDMALRVISYDGAAYRSQLLKDEGEENSRYPVITLVLYFGYRNRWEKAKTLYERLDVSEKLRPFVNDYRINLFEIAWLEEEQIKRFRSDFRIVADYIVQMRKNRKYQPSADEIRHVHEVLELMSVLTDDNRFEIVANQKKGSEVRTMCDVLDQVEERGKEIGKEDAILQTIKSLMESTKWTIDQTMENMKIPEADRAKYADKIMAGIS